MANSILAKMLVQISANTVQYLGAMAKADAATAKFQKNVGLAGKALLAGFGAQQIISGLQSVVGIMADFEVQMSTVKAITGATGKQFEALEKNALDLGRSTRYTATQVGSLQVEYGRLGFTTKEIINASKATLNLATATGSDLARSAEIAGATLRAFQIDAKETGHVTDVIASALNKSALALDSFGDAMKFVAPNAKAVNVSLEEASASLAVLADAGLKGTVGGTAFRKILTLLTKDGKPYADRLQELAEKGITLADANDEVGLTAQTALLILAKQNDKVKELTDSLKNNIGETQRMADIMEDNLTGSITRLSSAWDGLILSFGESKGVLRSVTDDLTDIVSVFGSDKISGLQKFLSFQALITGNVNAFNQLADTLKEVAKAEDEAVIKLDDFITKQAEEGIKTFGDNLDALKDAYSQNVNGAAIYARALEIQNKTVKESAEALTEQKRKVQAYRDAQLQLIKDNYERFQIERAITEELKRRITEINPEELNKQFGLGSGFGFGSDVFNAQADLGIIFPDDEAIDSKVQTLIDGLIRVRDQATETRYAFAQFADQVGNSLTQAIQHELSFAQAFAKVTAQLLDGIQARIIANIAEGSSRAFAKNPLLGIGIVTAGFAIAKGLLGQISNARQHAIAANNQSYSIELRQRGTDLQGSLSETIRIGTRTKG